MDAFIVDTRCERCLEWLESTDTTPWWLWPVAAMRSSVYGLRTRVRIARIAIRQSIRAICRRIMRERRP